MFMLRGECKSPGDCFTSPTLSTGHRTCPTNDRRVEEFAIVAIGYFVEENVYNLMNRFNFIHPFQDVKELNGVPKIG